MKFEMPKYEVLEMRDITRGDRKDAIHHDMVGRVKLEDGEGVKVSFWSGCGDDFEEGLDFALSEILEERLIEAKKAELRKGNRGKNSKGVSIF